MVIITIDLGDIVPWSPVTYPVVMSSLLGGLHHGLSLNKSRCIVITLQQAYVIQKQFTRHVCDPKDLETHPIHAGDMYIMPICHNFPKL